MRKVKIEYLDGTIQYEKATQLYIDCLNNIKKIDDVDVQFYGMEECEIKNELNRIGISQENILFHISNLPNPRPDLGENNLFKDNLRKYTKH